MAGTEGAAARFEYATGADPALNYCLWPYDPPAPAEDKFRSVNLLYHSFAAAGLGPRAYAVVDAIRDAIGPFRTVFGIKLLPDGLAWEFYFYDYARRQRQVSAARVLAALDGLLPCTVRPDESLPYFMFSLDLDPALAAGARALDVVHLYLGNPGSTVSSGVAYAVSAAGARLENFYFFFDAALQRDDIAKKIGSSVHFDETALPLDWVLVPELASCRTICLANKQAHDCIYFSGVRVEQLVWFLDRLRYPQHFAGFVREAAGSLDHLLFDVGFDYRMENGTLKTVKSGLYGIF